MTTATEIKGTFEGAIEITAENLQVMLDEVTPSDMKQEIEYALLGNASHPEDVVYYASWMYQGEAESRHYVLFPEAGRGGVCAGGFTEWTDAKTLDELEAAYDAGTING